MLIVPFVYSDFKNIALHHRKRTVLNVQILRDPTQNNITIRIIFDCRNTTRKKDINHWARLDSEFSKISTQIRHAECVFGFTDREEMVRFTTTILEKKMPAISRLASLRYSIHIRYDQDRVYKGWHQASLDSAELGGTSLVPLYVPRMV